MPAIDEGAFRESPDTEPRGTATLYFLQTALSGLRRHTTYHDGVVAVSVAGVTYGADRTFRTS